MGERGVAVDHTTVYRWTQRYAPELEKRSAWYRSRLSFSWRVDETYVRVKGRWKYLYRAIDKEGATLDFYLADRRNAKAAKRFLAKALRRSRDWTPAGHQHRQEPGLRRGDRRAEEGRPAAERHPAPTGEVSQQPAGGRPREAEALDPADARLPVDEDGLCDDQGLRGDADVQEGPVRRVDRCDRRRNRGALHQPPVRPLCVILGQTPSFASVSVFANLCIVGRHLATEDDRIPGKLWLSFPLLAEWFTQSIQQPSSNI